MRRDECAKEILIRGLDDWIQAAEVASVARTVGGAKTNDEVRALSLSVVRDLLQHELMEPGTVEGRTFTPWSVSVRNAMLRIEAEWPSSKESPGLGEICWLNLTDRGVREAQKLG